MRVYRIAGKKYASDLSGTGAAIYGGRWNKKATPVLYTGESREIALLEIVVNTPPMIIPELEVVVIEIPDSSIEEIKINELPSNWYKYPAPSILAEIGNKWIREQSSLALKVPSCVVHSANNYVINCRHPEFSNIKIIRKNSFYLDNRLLKT